MCKPMTMTARFQTVVGFQTVITVIVTLAHSFADQHRNTREPPSHKVSRHGWFHLFPETVTKKCNTDSETTLPVERSHDIIIDAQ